MEKSGDSASFWQWPGFSRQILVVRLRPWTSYLFPWQKACNLELQALWGQLSAAVPAWRGRGNPFSWPCEGSPQAPWKEEESETPATFANVWVLNVLLVFKDLVLDLENKIPGMDMSRGRCVEQGVCSQGDELIFLKSSVFIENCSPAGSGHSTHFQGSLSPAQSRLLLSLSSRLP